MSVFIGYPSFMAYQMMKGKKGNNDGFPSIPGMIARYSALGLTNEQMKENPVWVDKTGNGHDLQMKNFAWGGMSGVGGYKLNWSDSSIWANREEAFGTCEVTDNTIHITSAKTNNALFETRASLKSVEYKVLIKGLTDDIYLSYGVFNDGKELWTEIKNDGIYTLPSYDYDSRYNMKWKVMSQTYPIDCNITIEQLPLYPGFILGDGVDDFAVTEKELNFEDTYTVYTAFIPFQNNPTKNMMMAGKDIKDFYMNYSSLNALSYYSGNKSVVINLSNGFNLLCCKRDADNMTIKNLITGDSVTATANEFINNPGLYYLWRVANGYSYARLAIAGQTICNGYLSTDEDDEKVLDWYKKQYPWLFFDQAWTVVGKTNEDEDRATIANITGNGNDLVLSNFGFAEGSGYGLYGQNYISYAITNRAVYTKTNSSIHVTKSITAGVNFTESARDVTIPSYRIKVTGIQSGQEMIYRGSNNTFLTNIPSDGIYVLPAVENGSNLGFQFVSYTGDCDITIEQIPEYEGYLVTDGVDDKVESSLFTLNKDWTIVGNWTMLSNIPSNCGIIKVSSMFLYNSLDGVTIYFMGGPIKIQSKSINAFCSDGRIYLNDWTEILKPDAQIASGGSKSSLNIASYSANFTKMAFKNLAIYDGKNLSKDDCIKAYNYIQTLKAK